MRHSMNGELVPVIVSGIQVERWQRTVGAPKPPENTSGWTWHAPCFLRQIMSHENAAQVRSSSSERAAEQKKKPEQSFDQVLKKVPAEKPKAAPSTRPPPLPTASSAKVAGQTTAKSPSVVAASLKTHVAAQDSLGRARAAMNGDATRLQAERSEGLKSTEQRGEGRLMELILKELTVEFTREGDKGAGAAGASQELNPGRKNPSASAEGVQAITASARGAEGSQQQGALRAEAPPATSEAQAAARAQATIALVQRIETFVRSQRPALALTVAGALNLKVEVERTGRNEIALRVQGSKGPPPAEDVARIREAILARGLKLSSLSVG